MQTQPIFDGDIESDVFQKLGAEILEKGKVFQNLLVTDLLSMKIPKDFASSIFDYHPQFFIKFELVMKVCVFVISFWFFHILKG